MLKTPSWTFSSRELLILTSPAVTVRDKSPSGKGRDCLYQRFDVCWLWCGSILDTSVTPCCFDVNLPISAQNMNVNLSLERSMTWLTIQTYFFQVPTLRLTSKKCKGANSKYHDIMTASRNPKDYIFGYQSSWHGSFPSTNSWSAGLPGESSPWSSQSDKGPSGPYPQGFMLHSFCKFSWTRGFSQLL